MTQGTAKRSRAVLPGTEEQWREVGALIRATRLKRGFTSADGFVAANPIGIGPSQLRNYEGGYRPQFASQLAQLEIALKLRRGRLCSIVGIDAKSAYAPLEIAAQPQLTSLQTKNDHTVSALLERIDSLESRLSELAALVVELGSRLPVAAPARTRTRRSTARAAHPTPCP
jgi:hypothetical protein